MNKKRTIIIVVIVAALIIGGLIAYTVTHPSQPITRGTSQPDVIINQDKDTGEQLTTDPSLAPSESQDSSGIIVLGMADLIDSANLSSQQSDFLRTQLNTYGSQNLKNKYATLTIQPQNTATGGDTITTTVRLGDTDKTVAVNFATGNRSGTMQVTITDPSHTGGGDYSSPPTTLSAE